jgi:DNA-binding NarL/FixJ family response regulator
MCDGRTPAGGAPSDPVRIVIAERSDDLRTLLRLQLDTAAGYEVVATTDDVLGVAGTVADLSPHVVLLDIDPPGEEALRSIARIRTDAPTTTVVALTAYTPDGQATAALAAGASTCVEKGDLAVLLAALVDLPGDPGS